MWSPFVRILSRRDRLMPHIGRVKDCYFFDGGTKALSCGDDLGLAGGANHDFVLNVDFADAAAYEVYAKHPAHVDVITSHIKPILLPGSRTAVQFSLTPANSNL